SFCYVDDLIDGIYRLLLSDEHNPVNIGNPVETTILEFAETINQITKNPAGMVIKPDMQLGDDPKRRQPDITRARTILDWQPITPLEAGIQKTIPYFKTELGIA
ncbi:MAG TPA: SDR family NAD-dependent epimerase/dehydratase, partial [Anaerolineaceae bacterium]|nr:SDR family NAD-dependent epimerase/dehydratase [Anaerolineaceae bacterium]